MTNLKNTTIYKDIISKKIPCYFVSPHLDDAIFSAGALIKELRNNAVPVTLVNVFTSASKPPYTLSIKKFLRNCGYTNADDLYKDRVKEDGEVANKIGVKVINLGFTDALWRRKTKGFGKKLSTIIPELGYLYPIYRLSIAKGLILKEDFSLQTNIMNIIKKTVKTSKKIIVFGPSGIGKHTDHLIVRNALSKLHNLKVVYWGDYPYFENDDINKEFSKKLSLEKYAFKANSKSKEKLVMGYKSQIMAIFGDNIIDTSAEYYYQSKN